MVLVAVSPETNEEDELTVVVVVVGHWRKWG